MAARTALGLLTVPLALVSACAPELYKRSGVHPVHKRQHVANAVADSRGWTFDASEEWNSLHPDWGYCMNGTQQSPIAFDSSWMGLSAVHQPVFNYSDAITGTVSNWDFGASFTYGETGEKPTMQFEENGQVETVYFKSLHTHAPAEHTLDGWRPKAEVHFVHYDAAGSPRAVVGFFIDRHPQSAGSEFFQQFPTVPNFRDNQTVPDVTINLNLAINEVLGYTDFFTYQGSLTTPPCSEGLRWFMAKEVIWMSDEQMVELLDKSTFSARPTQTVWLHNVNA